MKNTEATSITRSYGQSDNYSIIQIEYMKKRLAAKKANKIIFDNTDESIEKLSKKLNIDNKKDKEKLSDIDILKLRIDKAESLLSNENFLKKVNDEVLAIKKKELEDLKKELESL